MGTNIRPSTDGTDKPWTECPKCALKANTLLHRLCEEDECPVRDFLAATKAASQVPGSASAGELSPVPKPAVPSSDSDGGPVEPAVGVSDTPRTDKHIEDWCQQSPDVDAFGELAAFTRQLERELAEMESLYREKNQW